MNIAYFKNIMSQLSNALSIVFISLKLVEILWIEVFSAAPPKGPQTLSKFPDTFFQMMIFHHFSSPKNGHMTTLATILGTIAKFWVPSIFFWKTYHVSYLRKKRRSLSRDIYLPSLIFLIFYQIHNILWYPKILPS